MVTQNNMNPFKLFHIDDEPDLFREFTDNQLLIRALDELSKPLVARCPNGMFPGTQSKINDYRERLKKYQNINTQTKNKRVQKAYARWLQYVKQELNEAQHSLDIGNTPKKRAKKRAKERDEQRRKQRVIIDRINLPSIGS